MTYDLTTIRLGVGVACVATSKKCIVYKTVIKKALIASAICCMEHTNK